MLMNIPVENIVFHTPSVEFAAKTRPFHDVAPGAEKEVFQLIALPSAFRRRETALRSTL